MSENDRQLISKAERLVYYGRDEEIDALIPLAESEKTRSQLKGLSWQAFKIHEIRGFDL